MFQGPIARQDVHNSKGRLFSGISVMVSGDGFFSVLALLMGGARNRQFSRGPSNLYFLMGGKKGCFTPRVIRDLPSWPFFSKKRPWAWAPGV